MAVTIKMSQMIALFMAVALLAGCSDDNAPMVKGQPTPNFSLQNLQGQAIHFPKDFAQQVVIISFWADWCPACKKEMRDFESILQKYKAQEFTVLAINIAQDKDTANAFIGDLNLSYDVLLDTKGDVAKAYAVSSIPSVFIINREGNLYTRILGESPPEVFEKILKLLFTNPKKGANSHE